MTPRNPKPSARTNRGAISRFMEEHYRHFNAAALMDAAKAFDAHLHAGGKMLVALAGAMSTAELGITLAEMIRRDKVHAVVCTGANLEEDIFNLVAHDYYERVPHYRNLAAREEQALLRRHMNRVTDTCIPEMEAMRRIEDVVLAEWVKADRAGERYFPHEFMYKILRGGQHPGMPRIDLVVPLQAPAAQDPVQELVREAALARAVGPDPLGQHRGLDAAHRLRLRDAGVRHAVHVAVEQRLLLARRQVAVVRHALVMVVRDQVEDVLLQVRARADHGVDLVASDHLGQRDAELGGRHGPGQRHQHLPARAQMRVVGPGRIHERGCVEVAVVPRDEPRHRPLGSRQGGIDVFGSRGGAADFHGGEK